MATFDGLGFLGQCRFKSEMSSRWWFQIFVHFHPNGILFQIFLGVQQLYFPMGCWWVAYDIASSNVKLDKPQNNHRPGVV